MASYNSDEAISLCCSYNASNEMGKRDSSPKQHIIPIHSTALHSEHLYDKIHIHSFLLPAIKAVAGYYSVEATTRSCSDNAECVGWVGETCVQLYEGCSTGRCMCNPSMQYMRNDRCAPSKSKTISYLLTILTKDCKPALSTTHATSGPWQNCCYLIQ